MRELSRFVRNWSISIATTFYTTFVLQMLWDWFVTNAFHVQEIRYWNMYGLVLIINIFSTWTLELVHAEQWLQTVTMLKACIPEEKQGETMARTQVDEAREEGSQIEVAMGPVNPQALEDFHEAGPERIGLFSILYRVRGQSLLLRP